MHPMNCRLITLVLLLSTQCLSQTPSHHQRHLAGDYVRPPEDVFSSPANNFPQPSYGYVVFTGPCSYHEVYAPGFYQYPDPPYPIDPNLSFDHHYQPSFRGSPAAEGFPGVNSQHPFLNNFDQNFPSPTTPFLNPESTLSFPYAPSGLPHFEHPYNNEYNPRHPIQPNVPNLVPPRGFQGRPNYPQTPTLKPYIPFSTNNIPTVPSLSSDYPNIIREEGKENPVQDFNNVYTTQTYPPSVNPYYTPPSGRPFTPKTYTPIQTFPSGSSRPYPVPSFTTPPSVFTPSTVPGYPSAPASTPSSHLTPSLSSDGMYGGFSPSVFRTTTPTTTIDTTISTESVPLQNSFVFEAPGHQSPQ